MNMVIDLIEPSLGEVVIVSYEGEFDDETGLLFHGQGSATMDNGCTYEGNFQNCLFHGKGKFTWTNNVSYEGDFALGIIVGKGTYKWHDGSIYEGDVKDGKRNGVGKFTGTPAYGQMYEGGWRGGKRHGKGKIWYSADNNTYYSGDWVDNFRDGIGMMKYSTGNSYEGEWETDKKCGLGVMIWKDLDELYIGQWKNDQPHGVGEYIWGDSGRGPLNKQVCNMYRGGYSKGKRHGYGTFFYMNGSQYSGTWIGDKKEGDGLFISAEAKFFVGTFEGNRMKTLPDDSEFNKRATDDISPQFFLHIHDIFERYPHLSDGSDSIDKQIESIQRVLLKYIQGLRTHYKRYSETSNRLRQREVAAIQGGTSESLTGVSSVEKSIITARNIQKRIYCLSFGQLSRFLRESGVISGPLFHNADVAEAKRRMRLHYTGMVLNKLATYRRGSYNLEFPEPTPPTPPAKPKAVAKTVKKGGKAVDKTTAGEKSVPENTAAKHTTAPPSDTSQADVNELTPQEVYAEAIEIYNEQVKERLQMIEETMEAVDWTNIELEVGSLLDDFFEPRAQLDGFDTDISQPILDREFMELIVRCVAEKVGRNGGGKRSLYHHIHQFLAEKVLPMSTDAFRQIEKFHHAYFHDLVQDLLRGYVTAATSFGGMSGSSKTNPPPAPAPAAAAAAAVVPESSSAPLSDQISKMWYHLTKGSVNSTIQLRTLLKMLVRLKGQHGPVCGRATVGSLLQAMELVSPSTSLPPNATPEEKLEIYSSCMGARIDFEDFLHAFCRLVGSSLWVYEVYEVVELQPSEGGEGADESKGEDTDEGIPEIDWIALSAALPTGKQKEDIVERKKLWKKIDWNGNNYLSLAEVEAGLKDLLNIKGFEQAKPAIARAFHASKKAIPSKGKVLNRQGKPLGDDFVEWLEFRIFLLAVRQRFEYYVAFKRIDSGSDGKISVDEFVVAKATIEKWVGVIEDMEAEFKLIDVNNSRGITFDEFCDWSVMKDLQLDDDDISDDTVDDPEEPNPEFLTTRLTFLAENFDFSVLFSK